MNVVILGATRGMGRAVARQLAERGDSLFLLGRDLEQLEHSAADLQVRGELESVGSAECDLAQPDTFAPALAAAQQALGNIDAVFVTAGAFATQAQFDGDLELVRHVTVIDYAHTVLFCEHARRMLMASGGGSLVVFSSVAGDRGRKPVVIYGSAKAGLSHYLESLDHAYRAQGLHTLCVKPGFVKTGMTEGLSPPPFAGEPEQVARDVLRALDRRKPMLYTPSMWALVMLVIRYLPRMVMRRINF